uniref:Uncharacterized protein n=1 Tax=Cucumis melo TaxID=3656 RepID=A0A9I9EET1_CUCME
MLVGRERLEQRMELLKVVQDPLGAKSLSQNFPVVSPQKEVQKTWAIKEPILKWREKKKKVPKRERKNAGEVEVQPLERKENFSTEHTSLPIRIPSISTNGRQVLAKSLPSSSSKSFAFIYTADSVPTEIPSEKTPSPNSSSVALSSSSLFPSTKYGSKVKSKKHPKSRILPHPFKTFPKHFVRRKRVKEALEKVR